MDRQYVGGGTWFNRDTAAAFYESTYHDGRNIISRATGSQWEHECLWRTRGGKWLLNAWSAWQGSRESWEVVDDDEAYAWLVKNEHYDDVPTVTESEL